MAASTLSSNPRRTSRPASSEKSKRSRTADSIGTSRYFAALTQIVAETLINKQERLEALEATLAIEAKK